ncbi:MAG TPA: MFS transporter [Candidatus Binataceae bacterium]
MSASVGAPQVDHERAGHGLEFWLVFIASSAVGIATNLFVFFPVLIVRLGGGAAQIGAIVGVGALAALAVRPGLVPLLKWRGRRAVALWSLVLDGAAMALYVPIHSLGWPIYAVRILQGAVDGTARAALFAMVFDVIPEGRRGEAMALFSLSGQGPAALGPPIGEALLKHFGFEIFFCVAGLLCLVAAIATVMLPAGGGAGGAHERDSAGVAVEGYRALVFDRKLAPLWIVSFVFAFAVAARLSFVAPFAYEKNIAQVGWYFALYSGIAVVLRLFGGRVLDRVGVARILGPAMGLLGIGVAVLALTGRHGALLGAAVLGGVGHSYAYPALGAMVITHTPAEEFGRSSVVYTSLYDCGSMLAPYLLGLFATLWGYGPMFAVAGLVTIATGVYFDASERREARFS